MMFLKIQRLHFIKKQTFFNKVEGLKAFKFIKQRLQHSFFLVNIPKFLRIAFLIKHPWWMLTFSIAATFSSILETDFNFLSKK